MRGISQIDFAIAVSLFIGLFAFSIIFVTDRFSLTKEEMETRERVSVGNFLLQQVFSYDDVVGIVTKAYKIEVAVNNSEAFLINQSQEVVNLTNELVIVNLSGVWRSDIDLNSLHVYDENWNNVKCNISQGTLKFLVNISPYKVKYFRVIFDDDSNFSSSFCNSSIVGTNNLTETVYPTEVFDIVQYKKFQELLTKSYQSVKNKLNMNYDFQISLKDSNGNSVFKFGPNIPPRGDIFALERNTLYQNMNADIKKGVITVYIWK